MKISKIPWIESLLLEIGAATVTTLEYNDIISNVKQLRVMKPTELRRIWKNKSVHRSELEFDVVITYSSIEHSGLGRYGDPLNPWGDLIASAQAW